MESMRRSIRDIDAFLGGYTLGTLIVDGGKVALETKNGEIVLDETYRIEVLGGDEYHQITYDQARNTMSRDGCPLYAGLEARVNNPMTKVMGL